MRQIKLRVWDGTQWSYFVIGIPFGGWALSVYDDHCLNGRKFYQSTGLLDKNGKEIFEGDIIKTGTDKPMVVTWSERFASFCIDRDGWAFKHWFGEAFESTDCEVIGNILQNPELL